MGKRGGVKGGTEHLILLVDLKGFLMGTLNGFKTNFECEVNLGALLEPYALSF